MLRNAGRNSTLLFRDLYALSTNSLMQSGHVVFKRETASNSPQAFVADDTKHASNGPNSVKVFMFGQLNGSSFSLFSKVKGNWFSNHEDVIMCNLFFELFFGYRSKPE